MEFVWNDYCLLTTSHCTDHWTTDQKLVCCSFPLCNIFCLYTLIKVQPSICKVASRSTLYEVTSDHSSANRQANPVLKRGDLGGTIGNVKCNQCDQHLAEIPRFQSHVSVGRWNISCPFPLLLLLRERLVFLEFFISMKFSNAFHPYLSVSSESQVDDGPNNMWSTPQAYWWKSRKWYQSKLFISPNSEEKRLLPT